MYEYLDRRYALALYNLGKEKNKVEKYIKEGKEIVSIIKSNKELKRLLYHPEISTWKKKEIFKEVFKGKIEDDVLNFILLLIEKDRILYFAEKIKEMEKIHLQKQNILIANVKSVIPLSEYEKKTLIKKLETKYSKKIILKEKLDKDLIGGMYIRIGDDVIDGSIKSQIEDIKSAILNK